MPAEPVLQVGLTGQGFALFEAFDEGFVKLTRCVRWLAPRTTALANPQGESDLVLDLHDAGRVRVGAVEPGLPGRPAPGQIETLGLLVHQRDDGVVGHRERLVRARHTVIYELLQSQPEVEDHAFCGSKSASLGSG